MGSKRYRFVLEEARGALNLPGCEFGITMYTMCKMYWKEILLRNWQPVRQWRAPKGYRGCPGNLIMRHSYS